MINKKLAELRPSVVFVQQDASYSLMCLLRDVHKVSLVTNMKPANLQMIERLTKTVTVNDLTEVDAKMQLGSCKEFKVLNVSKSGNNH